MWRHRAYGIEETTQKEKVAIHMHTKQAENHKTSHTKTEMEVAKWRNSAKCGDTKQSSQGVDANCER